MHHLMPKIYIFIQKMASKKRCHMVLSDNSPLLSGVRSSGVCVCKHKPKQAQAQAKSRHRHKQKAGTGTSKSQHKPAHKNS